MDDTVRGEAPLKAERHAPKFYKALKASDRRQVRVRSFRVRCCTECYSDAPKPRNQTSAGRMHLASSGECFRMLGRKCNNAGFLGPDALEGGQCRHGT